MAGGRPPKYETPEEMERVINLYFLGIRYNNTKDENLIKSLNEEDMSFLSTIDDTSPTMSGLAYYLGMSRQALCDYKNKDEFLDTIKKARNRVEKHLEQRLDGNAAVGTIFNLKNNFGWKDKREQENTHNFAESFLDAIAPSSLPPGERD